MAQISGKVLLIYTNLWCSSLSHRLICADAKLITYIKFFFFNPNLARFWVEDEAKNGVVCLARKYCTKKKVNLFGFYSSFIRQWYFQQITASIQTKQKVSKLPSLNVVANQFAGKCKKKCKSNACCNKRILELQPGPDFKASWRKSFLFRKLLTLQGTCAFSYWSFIVKYILGNSEKKSSRPLGLLIHRRNVGGNISYFVG